MPTSDINIEIIAGFGCVGLHAVVLRGRSISRVRGDLGLGDRGGRIARPSVDLGNPERSYLTVKRGRISPDRAKEFLKQIGAFNIRIANSPAIADFPRLQALAERHRLTSYDVAYLDLAASLSLPLATQDGDLCKAALAEGLEVLGQ